MESIKEVIILAGGLGTRLKEVTKDIPKPMALIKGKPFIEYLLDYIICYEIEKVIFSVGYKWQTFKNYFGESYKDIPVEYSIEEEPLDTGGAISKAINLTKGENVFIVNGDTFFSIDLRKLEEVHILKGSALTIALKKLYNFDRYGTVKLNKNNRIEGFKEKQLKNAGLINGGIYILSKPFYNSLTLPEKYSFEQDLLGTFYKTYSFYGVSFDNYFIDIGIPEDYEKADREILSIIYRP